MSNTSQRVKNNIAQLEAMMKRLDTIVGGHPHTVRKKLVKKASTKSQSGFGSALEKALMSSLSGALSSTVRGILGGGGSGNSQSQLLADFASAISKVSKRNL